MYQDYLDDKAFANWKIILSPYPPKAFGNAIPSDLAHGVTC